MRFEIARFVCEASDLVFEIEFVDRTKCGRE